MAANNTFGDAANTVGTLNGLFKQVYADSIADLIPEGFVLLKKVKFQESQKLGDLYNCPVILNGEHGVTFAASTEDAFTLNSPISGKMQNAQLRGAPMVLRSVLGYTAAARSQSSKGAFKDATKLLVGNMLKSMSKKLELTMLYGGSGIGKVSSVSGQVITITTAEWAAGIWIGSENMLIDIYDASGTVRVQNIQVSAVDITNRTITVVGTLTGVVATDVIFHKGANGVEAAGLHAIVSQTTGSLFGINVATYSAFKGNVYSAGSAALSFTKLQSAAALAAERGFEGKLTAIVSPKTWANLNSDQAALRKYDASYSDVKAVNGSRALTFYSQNGEIEIVPSLNCKEGFAYLISVEDLQRVGSSDISFNRPGMGSQQFFRDLDSAAGYELRCISDQALFTAKPAHHVVISGIVNS